MADAQKPKTTFLVLDTEGNARTGLRQVALVDLDSATNYFSDTVSDDDGPQRGWDGVGARFWAFVGAQGACVVLVGHNITAHDWPLLMRETSARCADAFEAVRDRVSIVDTLDIVRALVPFEELRDRRQGAVYTHLFHANPKNPHVALGDARALARIARHERFQDAVRADTFRRAPSELRYKAKNAQPKRAARTAPKDGTKRSVEKAAEP